MVVRGGRREGLSAGAVPRAERYGSSIPLSQSERTARRRRCRSAHAGVRTTRTPAVASHGSNPAAPLRISITEQHAAFQEETGLTRDLPQTLNQEGFVRAWRATDHLYAPRLHIQHEGRVIRHESARGPHLGGEKSAATSAEQCACTNVRHVIGSCRPGGMPSARRMRAIVDRPTWWPRFCNAP